MSMCDWRNPYTYESVCSELAVGQAENGGLYCSHHMREFYRWFEEHEERDNG